MTRVFVAFVAVLVMSGPAIAEVQTKAVSYRHGDVELEGLLAWDDAIKGPRPGVLVVHEWWGLNEYARSRAQKLAQLGYMAFAVDMYGKGKVTDHPDQAGKWMKTVQKHVTLWQARAIEGLQVLKAQKGVDPHRLAAIGYCFGGATVLQLAYSGADIKGVVSFHGLLPIPSQEQAVRMKAKVMIAHGYADPFVTHSQVNQFQKTLDEFNVDWQMVLYAGARHGFTNPNAGKYGIDAIQYNKNADARSWKQMQLFFDEIF